MSNLFLVSEFENSKGNGNSLGDVGGTTKPFPLPGVNFAIADDSRPWAVMLAELEFGFNIMSE